MKHYGYRTNDEDLRRELVTSPSLSRRTPWLDHQPGCFNGGSRLGSCTCGLFLAIKNWRDFDTDNDLNLWVDHRKGCLIKEAFCNCGLHQANPELWRI